jgi:hypothetical protein
MAVNKKIRSIFTGKNGPQRGRIVGAFTQKPAPAKIETEFQTLLLHVHSILSELEQSCFPNWLTCD